MKTDIMVPISYENLMLHIRDEFSHAGTIFGIKPLFYADQNKFIEIFEGRAELPFGPAAGPHTQLAQNIIAAYVGGARFFELKTVQILDGEDLPVEKPCIYASDECFNVEWSTELTVPQALIEYKNAWKVLKIISQEFNLGSPDGFIFNMSVGYDLEGIKSAKVDNFISKLKADGICNSITLSTLHGCPPVEIQRIAEYLITEKKLNTYIKCNPTLLGYEFARNLMDNMGYDYLSFDDYHFNNDLQYEDAVPMFSHLLTLAEDHDLSFGLKLTNTFPVKITDCRLPGEEMYMSGRSLFPLSVSLALKLSKDFNGMLPISFSGGVDALNIKELFETGIYPITVATTLLKPGGYQRLTQIAEIIDSSDFNFSEIVQEIDVKKLDILVKSIIDDRRYIKPLKIESSRKVSEKVPLIDCFFAPCTMICPINQDVPTYIKYAGEGKYEEAFNVILEQNPLPFMTGTICDHKCMTACRRNFYEESVLIRDVKLLCAEKAYKKTLETLNPNDTFFDGYHKINVAIIGGGPAGIAISYLLARQKVSVTVFEKREKLGGIVRYVIPDFRITDATIEKDISLAKKMGAKFITEKEIGSIAELQMQGFTHIVIAIGAWKPNNFAISGSKTINVIDFLEKFKKEPESIFLGENVVVIGGGNTAMDAARAAVRVKGVQNVTVVYRRDIKNMPADEEELEMALDDNVSVKTLLSPISFKESILKCEKMTLGLLDESNRRAPVGTGEFVDISANSIISAVGEFVDEEFISNNMGENVYVIGDASNGPSNIVNAIKDCHNTVAKILEISQASITSHEYNKKNSDKIKSVLKYAELIEPSTYEHERCLSCNEVCNACVEVCPNRANVAINVDGKPQILHIDRMCNECGNCTMFCPYDSSPYKEKLTAFHDKATYEASENPGFYCEGENIFQRVEKSYDVHEFINEAVEKYKYLI